jgi:hypothetical protein
MTAEKFLFLTNTPAHVHVYKGLVRRLRDDGHDVLVLARDYGCTVALLEYYDLPHRVYGTLDTTKWSLVRELPRHYYTIVRYAREFDPDCIFGRGSYAAHTGAITGTPTVLVVDSETDTLDHAISKPFARAILTPHVFGKDLGPRHYRFRGFKECAYLHPEVFTPAGDVRERLGVAEDERFALVRLNAFGSHHDVGQSGFSPGDRRRLIEELSDDVTVFVSDEGGRLDFDDLDAEPYDLHPALMHDALAEASLLVADTQTMVAEAALIGTPAIRSNSFVGGTDMRNFVELEAADLILNHADFDAVVESAHDLLADPDAEDRWERRAHDYLSEMVNLTDLLVEVAYNRGEVSSVAGLTAGTAGRGVDRPGLSSPE